MSNPFRYFNSSPEVTRPVVKMYVRYTLSHAQVASAQLPGRKPKAVWNLNDGCPSMPKFSLGPALGEYYRQADRCQHQDPC